MTADLTWQEAHRTLTTEAAADFRVWADEARAANNEETAADLDWLAERLDGLAQRADAYAATVAALGSGGGY